MPAGQQVDAVSGKGMTLQACFVVRVCLGHKTNGGRQSSRGVWGSRCRNSERTNCTALHSTSMPAEQQVDALDGKGVTIKACWKDVGVHWVRNK